MEAGSTFSKSAARVNARSQILARWALCCAIAKKRRRCFSRQTLVKLCFSVERDFICTCIYINKSIPIYTRTHMYCFVDPMYLDTQLTHSEIITLLAYMPNNCNFSFMVVPCIIFSVVNFMCLTQIQQKYYVYIYIYMYICIYNIGSVLTDGSLCKVFAILKTWNPIAWLNIVVKFHANMFPWVQLTHWGRVSHICVGKLTIIGSANGLSPGRRQAIIWTNAGILLIGPLRTNLES